MIDVKIWYDPMISIIEELELSERFLCGRTGIARRIFSKLKLHTVKAMFPDGVTTNKIHDEYYPSIKTCLMLSFGLNRPMDELIRVSDPFDPTKIITVAEARKKFNQMH